MSDTVEAHHITSVERDTGISKDTLRMWERRYSFPRPGRDASGDRVYSNDDVEKLTLIKRLVQSGKRPAKVVGLSKEALAEMAALLVEHKQTASVHSKHQEVAQCIELLKTHQIDVFRKLLETNIVKHGLAATIQTLIAPLTHSVGEYWRRGELQIYEEHLFTEVIQALLRNCIHTLPRSASSPTVLLTTLPKEPHILGLLMAQSMLALEGCTTVSLGAQTPVWDIVQACKYNKINIVTLSFSSFVSQADLHQGLRELRHQLPPSVEIWAGGKNAALSKRLPEGVVPTIQLEDISSEVARWKKLHALS